MNKVTVSGRVVSRQSSNEGRRVRQVSLEVYNRDVRDVIRAVVYGRLKVEALPEGLVEGVEVEMEGRLTNIHWRTPGAGNLVRQLGVDVWRVSLVQAEDGAERGRVRLRPTPAQVEELRRQAGRLGLDADGLREYLEGREPEDVPRNQVPDILQRMAQEAKEKEAALRGAQLDQLVAEGGEDAQLTAWAKKLCNTPLAELEAEVAALPDDDGLRQAVLEEALKREERARGRSILERLLQQVAPAEARPAE